VNFLAHSLLAFDDTDVLAGQICGDFVRGSDLSRFPEGVEKGIRLHRYLDRFTDTHQILVSQKRALSVVPRRFAGILIDVLFDHYLAVNWHSVSHVSLDKHADHVHRALQLHKETLPGSLRRFMKVLHSERILQKNDQLPHIAHTLERIASRSTRLTDLALTHEQLKPLVIQLNDPFEQFYPALHQAALDYLTSDTVRESSL
jgi:acyl carrier protein phosphodiesterase